ncbi:MULTISPECIES: hypothetical protein [Halocynthiibacter]|uniref:Lipoprotein n=1 Tax=Halocynthiibacter halioticoli TaxID=2986804 RepID=A0AAE3IW46_9RHOB|nr:MULTISPECIES: hypothetical protein [Halocynthiibacter]MCV6823225.1 hypothetical protein [Halocynthiibacter halioticoli]MCW4056226.1 hypothetical protein [Halocynthiibacter sp. SDUM655004]
MRQILLGLFGVLLIAGCDSPHPKMMGVKAQEITVEGSTFRVRTKGEIAEAIRVGFVPFSEHAQIPMRAVVAMEEASGCDVDQRSVKGDPALIVARLKCPKS